MNKGQLYITIILLILITEISPGQTCSCAGNPSFNPIDQSIDPGKKWYFEVGHRYHRINELVRGTKVIENEINRKRSATNIYAEIRYTPLKNITFSLISGAIRQYRKVGRNFAESITNLGDTLISVQYSPFISLNRRKIKTSTGFGIKLPTGKSNAVLTGIAAEDMQPGTGSVDFVIRQYISIPLFFNPYIEIFAGNLFRFNGTNGRSYKFGGEYNFQSGFSTLLGDKLNLLLYGRFRSAAADRRFGGTIPNTGGKWIYLASGFTFRLNQGPGVRAIIEIPVYRKLNGAEQFTSKFITSLSLFFDF